MNDADIAAAKVRAEDVLNGFTRGVIAQHARDVVKLAEALQDANREVNRLNEIIASMRKVGGTQDQPFDSIFSTIFGGKP